MYAQYDRDVFMYRGRAALAEGKFAKAIENFNILERLDSTDYENFFFRGIAKYNLGDFRGAKKDFNTSVRINPVFTSGYHYRGITESRTGNYEAALKDIDKAIELRPGYPGLYFSRGVTHFLSQNFEAAVSDFDKYIRKEPRDPSAYLNRGASLLFLGDTLKALNDYNKAIRLDRFDPEGYVRRGRLYAAQKNNELAIRDMDKAISIDTSNTFAYFNRAILHYESKNYRAALEDLDRVLADEPGNALTLYNRGLILAQLGDFEGALSDLDRVLNINPDNVLAHFNRASVFIEMGMYRDALEDYDAAIELYPDFAKAYMNRSYVKNQLGMHRESKEDYETAKRKVEEYRKGQDEGKMSLSDTSARFSALLALDADFARKDFNDEMLQHRDVDIKLRPLLRFVKSDEEQATNSTISHIYENPLLKRFVQHFSGKLNIGGPSAQTSVSVPQEEGLSVAMREFSEALDETGRKHFNAAMMHYDQALAAEPGTSLEAYYRAFYLMNRAVLRADMIEFISSMENNVQTLSMDDSGNTRARVKDQVSVRYDYSSAIDDLNEALEILPDLPYLNYNLGNLYCLSSDFVKAIEAYSRAVSQFPYLGDAWFNRGLVQVYLKEREKGCMDLSRAGELGVSDAYGVIKKFCEE
ncbi:MAG: tetratricopeptide repeat protein [Candidatus Cryptobacteroides sp.]